MFFLFDLYTKRVINQEKTLSLRIPFNIDDYRQASGTTAKSPAYRN